MGGLDLSDQTLMVDDRLGRRRPLGGGTVEPLPSLDLALDG
jgi:hypothetical protein